MKSEPSLTGHLFNSAFEVGFRSLVMLAEIFPKSADLQKLVFFDYLMIHSGDIANGPPSLHPATPFRSQEFAIRRDALRQGLLLMASRGLVNIQIIETGIDYAGSEETIPFLDRMTSTYTEQLSLRASWVSKRFIDVSNVQLLHLFNENIGKWGSEFLFMRDFSEELSALDRLRG